MCIFCSTVMVLLIGARLFSWSRANQQTGTNDNDSLVTTAIGATTASHERMTWIEGEAFLREGQ